jgi:hypothetical protein
MHHPKKFSCHTTRVQLLHGALQPPGSFHFFLSPLRYTRCYCLSPKGTLLSLSVLSALDIYQNMFLSRWAEPLFGVLAPRSRSKDAPGAKSNAQNSKSKDADNRNDTQDEVVNSGGDVHPPEKDDPEKSLRKRRLECQRKMEAEAESLGAFAKKQRVKYHNKLQGRWHDAVVIGVHHDDGPDKPYYVSVESIASLWNLLSSTKRH